MIFADLWFAGFIPCAVIAVWLAPAALRRLVLLAACAVFHAHYAGPAGVGPILILGGLVYLCLRGGRGARLAAVTGCVLSLLYYKYSAMLNETLHMSIPVAVAPLAISFFVFEFVHQLLDRDRDKLAAGEVKPMDFSLFAIFFPSLAAGPLKRYRQFVPELARLGLPSRELLTYSLARILLGYFKKFCVGDLIAREVPNAGQLGYWHSSVAALALLQGVRIFVDFSGYSDIAIGLAGLFNVRLPENFSFPYLASNISDFWRRWHISLSTWIRDYVYILMGGNRVSPGRRAANLLAAMVLCGLWHGASGHFAAWGLAQGLALLGLHFWRRHSPVRVSTPIAWALTFAFVQLSWLLFFYNTDELLRLFREAPLV